MINFKDPTTKLSTLLQVFQYDMDRMKEQRQFNDSIDRLREEALGSQEREDEEKLMVIEDRMRLLEYLIQSLLRSSGGNDAQL